MAASRPSLIQSTRADGSLDPVEEVMQEAVAKGNENAFAHAAHLLFKDRPIAAILHVDTRIRTIDPSGPDEGRFTKLLLLRTDLIHEYGKTEPACAAHVALLCANRAQNSAAYVGILHNSATTLQSRAGQNNPLRADIAGRVADLARVTDGQRVSGLVGASQHAVITAGTPGSTGLSDRDRAMVARAAMVFARKEGGQEDAEASMRVRKASAALAAIAGNRADAGRSLENNV